jgi:hypothetical protein
MNKKRFINKEIFDEELLICQKLSKENKGKCHWGKCSDCGVIPLLYKLYKGQLLEKSAEIKKIKQEIFKK